MESLQSFHTESKLTSSSDNSHISDPQIVASEPVNKDVNESLNTNLQMDIDGFPNIDLLGQSQKHGLDNKSMLSSKFSEPLSMTTESHDIDILDDIPPLENITEEVEDIGVIVTDLDLGITHEPEQKIDTPHTPLIPDKHNENSIDVTNDESIPILEKKGSDINIQKETSIVNEDTSLLQSNTIHTENTENIKDKDIESKKNIENSNISPITRDISNLPDINTSSDLKVLDMNEDIKKSIDETTKENLQQPSNENINKEDVHDDIDMTMKQEDVDAMNLELPTNLGDDDFPKLYDFDTKDNDDIFSSHDILKGSIQTKKDLNGNNTQILKENDVSELSTPTDDKLQEENRTDLSIFKYGLNTSLCLPKTDDINDNMNIDDLPFLNDGHRNNERLTSSKNNAEQASNISTRTSSSLNNSEKFTDLQDIPQKNSTTLDEINTGASSPKIRQEEKENKTINNSDGSPQLHQDTFDKSENRNTPASIISEKNNLLYRKRKNSLIPGTFYPNNLSGHVFNSVISSNSNNNLITAEAQSELPLESALIVSNDSVSNTNIPKIKANGKPKSELSPEIPKEQPTIFAYARLDFQSFTFYVQTLHAVIGRRSENDTTHKVDVNLGPSKSISRRHAQIFYNFGTGRFELSIIGKNGAFVDDVFVERGNTVPLHNKTKIQIGQIPFQFVLPEKDEQKQQKNMVDDKKETKERTKEQNTTQNSESKPKPKPQNKTDTKSKEPKKKATNIPKPAKKEPKEKEKKIPKPPKKVYTLEEIPVEYRTKPSFSYSAMLTTCIRKYSTEQGMSLSEIYEGIRELYPYYKYCPDGWQSSVRHNLSLNKSFRKVCKKGKGWLWGLDEAYIAEREKIKQKQAEAARAKAQAAQLKLQQQNVAKGKTLVTHGKKQVKANISQTLSANRSGKNGALTINKQSAPPQNAKRNDTQRTMKFLQEQLIIMTRDRKGLDKPTIAAILTQALAMTINQVTQAAKSQGIKGNPLTALMDKNPQHLNLILSAAVNAATAKVTKGKVKQLVDPSVLQEINAKTSVGDYSNAKKNKNIIKMEKDARSIRQTNTLTKLPSKSNSSSNTNKPNTSASSSVSPHASSVSTPSAPSGGFDPTSLSRFFQPKNQNNRMVTSSSSSSTNHNRSTTIPKASLTSVKRPHETINTKENNKRLKPSPNSGNSNGSSESDTSDSSDSSDTNDSSDLSDGSTDNISGSDSSINNDTDSDSSDNDSTKAVNNSRSTNDQEQKRATERIIIGENNETKKENLNKENDHDDEKHATDNDEVSNNEEQDRITHNKTIDSNNADGSEDNKNVSSENIQMPLNEVSDDVPEPIKENVSKVTEESIEPTESSLNEQLCSEEEKKKIEDVSTE